MTAAEQHAQAEDFSRQAYSAKWAELELANRPETQLRRAMLRAIAEESKCKNISAKGMLHFLYGWIQPHDAEFSTAFKAFLDACK